MEKTPLQIELEHWATMLLSSLIEGERVGLCKSGYSSKTIKKNIANLRLLDGAEEWQITDAFEKGLKDFDEHFTFHKEYIKVDINDARTSHRKAMKTLDKLALSDEEYGRKAIEINQRFEEHHRRLNSVYSTLGFRRNQGRILFKILNNNKEMMDPLTNAFNMKAHFDDKAFQRAKGHIIKDFVWGSKSPKTLVVDFLKRAWQLTHEHERTCDAHKTEENDYKLSPEKRLDILLDLRRAQLIRDLIPQ